MVMPVVAGAPGASLREFVAERRAELSAWVARAGAILFQGFDVTTPEALGAVAAAAAREPMRYVGGDSPRTHLAGDVYTSTEVPAHLPIPLHNEMSFLPTYPRWLWLACASAPDRGGETTLADGRTILREIDPGLRDRFLAHGVHYVYSLRGPSFFFDLLNRVQKVTRTWMETLETDDRRLADTRASAIAAQHRWLPSGRLVLDLRRPATVVHPDTGEQAWFNQAHLFRFNPRALGWRNYVLARAIFCRRDWRSHDARFGDESSLDGKVMRQLFDVLDRNTVAVRWQRGDVLWVDNLVCMHGRRPFRGPRRVLVAMTR
jgi:alpha-ketoglutarate-dependent taurine dioxygenase